MFIDVLMLVVAICIVRLISTGIAVAAFGADLTNIASIPPPGGHGR